MSLLTFDGQQKFIDITNNACYLLSMHIESNFKEIVIDIDENTDCIVEAVIIVIPKTDSRGRNKAIKNYFIEKMATENMEFCKIEKHCFDNQIYYDLCFKEIENNTNE